MNMAETSERVVTHPRDLRSEHSRLDACWDSISAMSTDIREARLSITAWHSSDSSLARESLGPSEESKQFSFTAIMRHKQCQLITRYNKYWLIVPIYSS